ncbi:MAG: helix-turn-helix domain-containing protein [Candidatus Sulfotelmatobacter sp.]
MNNLQYERERLALGDELRTLRKAMGLVGDDLAKSTGISQSKLSKIETGALVPSTDDLLKMFKVLRASQEQRKKVTEWAQALRTEFVSWRFGHRKGFSAKQVEVAKLDRQAHRIRMFQIAAIPGLLQTPEYAYRVMGLSNVTHQPDLEQAVGLRMQRQQLLYEPGRQFEFLMTESAALSRFCDPAVARRQLKRLRFLFDIPYVRIGFLPNRTSLPRVPTNSFIMYDSSLVVVETLAGEISTVDEKNIEQYNAVFDELASVAVFGNNAEIFLNECEDLMIDLESEEAGHSAPNEMQPFSR